MNLARDLPLLLALVLLFLSAVFLAAAETSIIRIPRVRADTLAREGSRQGRRLVALLDELPTVLNTVLLAVLLVQIGSATITSLLAQRWFGNLGVTVASVVLTVVLFVYSEAIPKTFAVRHPDRVALAVVYPIALLELLLRPMVKVLVLLADLQAPGRGIASSAVVTEGELRQLAAEAEEVGHIAPSERELIERVFRLDERIAEEVMVPRPDIVALPAHTPVEEALQVALSAGHGRLPLYEGTIDNITGVVHLRDLVRAMDGEGGEPVLRLSRPPLVVPESKRVVSLLREMQEAGSHLAVVVDEYGGTSGLVTIEDVMEELVGEVADEGEEEQPAELHHIEEGRWLVDGGMLVEDLESLLEAGLPEGDWHTVGGLVMGVAGKVPSTGDEVVIGGFSFRVTSASRRRIRQVQIERRGFERR